VKVFVADKIRLIGLPYGAKNMLSRFHLIPERYRRTDGQTDRIALSMSRVSVLTRDNNVRRKKNKKYEHDAKENWPVYDETSNKRSSSAVAKRPRDVSCLSVV